MAYILRGEPRRKLAPRRRARAAPGAGACRHAATPGLVFFTTPPTEPPLDRPEGRPRGVAPPMEVLGSGRDSGLRPRSLRASVESRSAQLFVLLRRGETGGGACGVGVAFHATRFIVPFCHVN